MRGSVALGEIRNPKSEPRKKAENRRPMRKLRTAGLSTLGLRPSFGLRRSAFGFSRGRSIRPELLDELLPADPRALRSRRDLQRLNACMGNAVFMARALRASFPDTAPAMVTEVGGGDGTFLLSLLERMARFWQGRMGKAQPGGAFARAVLVDRHGVVAQGTVCRLASLGWRLETIASDVFHWLEHPPAEPKHMMLANLFLHHFPDERLGKLFEQVAQRTQLFIALEPRRSALASFFSRCVGLIGCGPVTRHDAPVSVQAGFADHELSRLWPARAGWSIAEGRAGLFGHLFIARRESRARSATPASSLFVP